MKKYMDSSRSVEERVSDLLGQMTVDEKIAQLGSVWAMELLDNRKFSIEKAGSLMKLGLGQVSRAGVGTGLEPEFIARFVNDLQSYLVKETRLGVPAIVHEECLSGFMARRATIFPQMIGMASTFEPSLVERMMVSVRRQMLAVGVRQGLSPVLDIARDPRWGRIEETFGEDPYLVSVMAIAYINGLQGEDIRDGVIATAKHFAGYGKPEGGLNHAPADIPPRMLRDVYLYPFKKAVQEAKVLSVMNAYQEIDGIPCAASVELLTNILRDEWGFEGIVVSDYYAVQMLNTFHMVAAHRVKAARMAMTAGIDVELPRYDCYNAAVGEAVADGTFPEDLINRAAARVLAMKFRLGLFENPYVGQPYAGKLFDIPADRMLSLEAARKSIILLKNANNLLPLDTGIKKIAVIGPAAADPRNQLGDYTYAAQIGLTAITAESLGCKLPAEDMQPDMLSVPVTTLLDALKVRFHEKMEILHAEGCGVKAGQGADIAGAVALAKGADIVIAVLGGKSGLLPDCTCGEMRDSSSLRLHGEQEQLLCELCNIGNPVVLVIMDGRPIELGWIAEIVPAIVLAWKPGEEGGTALVDVLFGDCCPGGKLPVTWPRSVGQIPIYYSIKPSGGKSQFWGDYTDCPVSPQYEFGFGLSYTNFELSALTVSPKTVKTGDIVCVKLDVRNTGHVEGDEVVQVYISDIASTLTRPVLQLKAFSRITLRQGEKKGVELKIPVSELTYYGADMKLQLEPGTFSVLVGNSSKNILLADTFDVVA